MGGVDVELAPLCANTREHFAAERFQVGTVARFSARRLRKGDQRPVEGAGCQHVMKSGHRSEGARQASKPALEPCDQGRVRPKPDRLPRRDGSGGGVCRSLGGGRSHAPVR
ncbi:MAG: hypothetical protein Kow0010_06230 [Dehalococcoidia bacterium]